MNRYSIAFDQSSFGNGVDDDRQLEAAEETVNLYNTLELAKRLPEWLLKGDEPQYAVFEDWLQFTPADVLIVDEDDKIFNREWASGGIRGFILPLLVAKKGKTWESFSAYWVDVELAELRVTGYDY